METRQHVHEIELTANPEHVFSALITPSAIRVWWGAARAVVLPQEDGFWAASWGDEEDDPDYITAFAIWLFDPPRRLLLADAKYHAKTGQPPFEAKMTTEFTIEPRPNGCLLRVVQDGFPADSIADDFFAACEVGWKTTFDSIKQFVESPPSV